ncbi:hypothetical protein GCM10023221_30670 [Luteimicrobium xylanilyticum]|uniref:DUF222 domain-containing protein n=2 Tax=Luteimicrobium xylanilyticum TaxID=1133546 RepID=A0A5P9Q6E5_9MICO|nr:uncharacterized protein KDY119_00126 [Luteimicrobium xylanilyticum]
MFDSQSVAGGAEAAGAPDRARGDASDLDATSARAGNESQGASSVLDLALASLLTRALELREASWQHGAARPADGDRPAGAECQAAGSDAAEQGPPAPDLASSAAGLERAELERAGLAPAGIGPAGIDLSGINPAGVDAVVLGKAAALSRAELADLDDDALIEAAVAWQHVASWAVAAQARVVAELLARGGASSAALEAVTHELTAALVTSRHAASRLAGRAAALSAAPEVADALSDGRIDTARADALLTSESVPLRVRQQVAADLVGTAAKPGPATGLTPRQLRDRLRRAAIEVDPDGAAQRAVAATAERHVWIDPAPDQMAWLTAHLPAADAARIWARLDASARHAVRLPDEDRTLGQLRADALTQLVTTDTGTATRPTTDSRPTTGTATRATTDTSARPVPAVRTVVNVTVSADSLLGLDESPAQLAGYGPVPAPVARVLASDGDATWRRILTDPTTGAVTDVSRTGYRPGVVLGDLVRTREPVCTFPGCEVPAARCDLDHIEPFDPARSTAGQTRASNLHPACRAHHNAKTHGGWSTRTDDEAIVWSAPSGRTYRVPPTPTDTSRATGPVTPTRPRPRRAGPHDTGAPPPGPPRPPVEPLGDPPF